MTRRAVTVAFLCCVTSMYLFFVMINQFYQQPWYKFTAPCMVPKFIADEMTQLTFDVSNQLTKLNMSHTLCYGTLWGALRYGKALPWDNNVDFCVLKHEVEKVPWATLYEQFKASNMDMIYDPHRGAYIVSQGHAQAHLTVFYKTSLGKAHRDGFQNKFLWFLQNDYASFPSRLLEPPFTMITFQGNPMPVPNGDMEILKHLYKNDWWLEEPPQGCSSIKT
jgi:hypothetical protein